MNNLSQYSTQGKSKIMANSAVSDRYCFHNVDVMLKVALQPLYSSQPLDAVKQQLNNMLYKYSESLEGIPLSFSDISFPKGKEYARIMADQFWLHVDVCTKILIFKPVVGQTIRGKASKVRYCAQSSVPVVYLMKIFYFYLGG